MLDPTGSVDRIFRQYLNVREFDNPSPLQELLGQDVLQLTAFFDADYEKQMLPRMPHCVSGRWHPEFTDITAREADKGKGIQAIARHMGFDPSRTIAFGDGGNDQFRRVLLGHSQQRKGPFSNFLNESQIELIQLIDTTKRQPRKIYDFETHLWGDPGFIQICYDIRNMKELKEYCESKGCPFTTDSNPEASSKTPTATSSNLWRPIMCQSSQNLDLASTSKNATRSVPYPTS